MAPFKRLLLPLSSNLARLGLWLWNMLRASRIGWSHRLKEILSEVPSSMKQRVPGKVWMSGQGRSGEEGLWGLFWGMYSLPNELLRVSNRWLWMILFALTFGLSPSCPFSRLNWGGYLWKRPTSATCYFGSHCQVPWSNFCAWGSAARPY